MAALALAVALSLCGAAHASVPADATPEILEVKLNGIDKHLTGTLWTQGKSLAAEPSEWVHMGLVLSPAEQGKACLSTDDLGLSFQIDEDTQTVDLKVPAKRLPAQTLDGGRKSPPPPSPTAPGLLVNFDIAGTWSQNFAGLSFGHELRAEGQWGILLTTGQLDWNTAQGTRYVRGQTRWQWDDEKHLMSYEAGDVMAGGITATPLGGFRIAHDPADLDPSNPVYPLPTIGGIAEDPGTLAILANQSKVSQTDVQAGPFQIERFPVQAGLNAMDLVLKDQYGREQVVSQQQLYFTPSVLREGLTTWDFTAGKIREGSSDTYAGWGAAGEMAHGINDRWTLSGSMEAGDNGWNASVGTRNVMGLFGVVNADLAASHSDKGTGARYEVGYDYSNRNWSIDLLHSASSRAFWQLSELQPFGLQVRREDHAQLSWHSDDRQWSGRLGYEDLLTNRTSTHYLELGGDWHRGSQTLDAQVQYDLVHHEPILQVSYHYLFGQAASVSSELDATRQDVTLTTTAQTQGKTKTGGDYTLVAQSQNDDHHNDTYTVRGTLQNENSYTIVSASDTNGKPSFSGSYSGSLFIDGSGFHRLRTATDGYAVVRIPGVAGVPVKLNDQVVGKTDASGELVVGPMAALVGNKISVDDKLLPMEVTLESSEQLAVSKRLSGAFVQFPVRSMHARTFTVTRNGKNIEAGAAVKTKAEESAIGYDGALYLEKPEAGMDVSITDSAGTCHAQLPTPLPAFDAQISIECQ